jgi:UPF0042 nucleotide-binding protein
VISLIVVSGRSGSGKSTALHVLEDMGHYCIDNLPVTLLPPLIDRLSEGDTVLKAAVSIDARNIPADLSNFSDIMDKIDSQGVTKQILYLDSLSATLFQRFSETRRKHPLTDEHRDLREALDLEAKLLVPISNRADLTIDTTSLTIHQLRDLIRERVAGSSSAFALMFESFAYKKGVPIDADFVFDVRCLPNPHWKLNLRSLTGLDKPVQEFLNSEEDFTKMHEEISGFLHSWLPRFEASSRSYMTVAIGCTGGQHRSVYMCNKLFSQFREDWENVQIRHRELDKIQVD